MFGSNKKEKQVGQKAPTSVAKSGAINSIVEGTHLEGKVKAVNDFRIDGELIGSLDCKGKVIIGPTGVVDGDVVCQNAVIEGRFSGSIKINELLSVKVTGNVTGDIDTNKLIVDSGAVFNVNCNMAITSNLKDIHKSKSTEKEAVG